MNSKRSIIYIIVSNVFDYYSITLYAFFATILTPLFFLPQIPTTSVLIAFAFFATRFLMRPVGTIFFGTLGDQKGRKKTLLLSIILTATPAFIISFLPTYDQIGLLCSIIIVICRLVQGFSIAASENGPVIFVSEYAKQNQDGFAGSLLSASSLLGAGYVAPVNAVLPKLFSADKRYSGMGFSFSVGATLFEGFTPLAISFINYMAQTEVFLAIYLMFIKIVGWCSLRNIALYKVVQNPYIKTSLTGEMYET